MAKCRVAAVQMRTVEKKSENVNTAAKYINDLMNEVYGPKPDIIVLPEMFNCPYENENFPFYAEERGEITWKHMSELAAHFGVYIVAGSIPEYDENDCVYNTCYVFDREGRQIAKHRKIHLFDVDIPGMRFRESATFSPGEEITVFDTEFGKMGAAICFDVRFPELFRAMAVRGAKVIFLPAQFNMATGPAHWAETLKIRAVDNELFFVGASAARYEGFDYECWGHSVVYDPFGIALAAADETEQILFADLDLRRIDEVRAQLPTFLHLKRELYTVAE